MISTTTGSLTNSKIASGWLNGFIGVLIFSGSMPATKIAVMDMSPVFVTVARATVAGLLALGVLLLLKEKRPAKNNLWSLIIVAFGAVIGFPLLSSLALAHITSAHSLVFLGLLPLATAVFAVLRGGEKPKRIFWFFSVLGSLLVIGYAVYQGIQASPIGDLLMLAGIVLCGLAYAEGAHLSKTMGGWQVISWALVISLPLMLPLVFVFKPVELAAISTGAWYGLMYISLFSMFIGFIFWYKGLALGGIATVGQLQLLQPFFGLALAATLLHEEVSFNMVAITMGIILCVACSKKFAR